MIGTKDVLAKSVVATIFGLSALTANASLFTADFGNLVPGYAPNDDVTFASVSLPFSINYFGTTYNGIFVNNNGNATFGAATGSYTPAPLNTQTTQPMIAPYWTDLDSRNDPLGAIVAGTGGSGVYFRQVSPSQVVMTWDRLGYYPENYTGRVQFQLVLNDPNSAIPAGQGVIGFYYGPMTSGTDGHAVTVGFGDGQSTIDPGEVQLFAGPSAVVSAQTAALDHQWFGLNGQGGVVIITPPPPNGGTVPEPGTLALIGAGLAAFSSVRRRRKD